MPKEKPLIGMGMEEARQKLVELALERAKIVTEMAPLTPKSIVDIPVRYVELSNKLNALDNQIGQVREWYHLGVSELLYNESKRLNSLTTWLIILTAVLGGLTIIDILSRVIIHV